jgi:CRISP-associated protein Cas1
MKRKSFHVLPPTDDAQHKEHTISPHKLTSIAVTQNIMLSADAVRLAVQHQIPILFFDKIGKAEARLWSPYFESIATLRRQQVKFAEAKEATQWVVELFRLKTAHQLLNLRALRRKKTALHEILDKAIGQMESMVKQFEKHQNQKVAEVRSSLMGVEGSLARVYFQSIAACLPPIYQFDTRNRRPAKDMFNASLNYFYGMLYTVVEGALFGAGLDPHLGILHADEYNKPILAFDLIEPFRPWIDGILIEMCMEEHLLQSFFTANQYGMVLNKNGKAVLIPRFNTWLQESKRFNERNISTRNQIYHFAGLLATQIRTL